MVTTSCSFHILSRALRSWLLRFEGGELATSVSLRSIRLNYARTRRPRFGWAQLVLFKCRIKQRLRLTVQRLKSWVLNTTPCSRAIRKLLTRRPTSRARLSCAFTFLWTTTLMKHFGAETVKALFERLGVDKSECIEHHLIEYCYSLGTGENHSFCRGLVQIQSACEERY
jgi:hypothetical protein